jgi:hypothetical protein
MQQVLIANGYRDVGEILPEQLYTCKKQGKQYSAVKEYFNSYALNSSFGGGVAVKVLQPYQPQQVVITTPLTLVSQQRPFPAAAIDNFFRSLHEKGSAMGGNYTLNNLVLTQRQEVLLINVTPAKIVNRKWDVELAIRAGYNTLEEFVNADYVTWRQQAGVPLTDLPHYVIPASQECYYQRWGYDVLDGFEAFARYLQRALAFDTQLVRLESSTEVIRPMVYWALRLPTGHYVDKTGVYFDQECARSMGVSIMSINNLLRDVKFVEEPANARPVIPPSYDVGGVVNFVNNLVQRTPPVYFQPTRAINPHDYLQLLNSPTQCQQRLQARHLRVAEQLSPSDVSMALRLLDLDELLHESAAEAYQLYLLVGQEAQITRVSNQLSRWWAWSEGKQLEPFSLSRRAERAMRGCLLHNPLLMARLLDYNTKISNYRSEMGGELHEMAMDDAQWLYLLLRDDVTQTAKVLNNLVRRWQSYCELLLSVILTYQLDGPKDQAMLRLLVDQLISHQHFKPIFFYPRLQAVALQQGVSAGLLASVPKDWQPLLSNIEAAEVKELPV